jgi:hypothetical protein
MPTDNRLRLDNHQRLQNARCDPIEAAKDEAIKIVEGDPLSSRPKKPCDYPADQFEHVSHEAEHRPIRGFMPVGQSLR